MNDRGNPLSRRAIRLIQGGSAAALALGLLLPASALAADKPADPPAAPQQTTPTTAPGNNPQAQEPTADIVVTGFRQSLERRAQREARLGVGGRCDRRRGHRQVPRPEPRRIAPAHPRHLDPARRRRRPRDHRPRPRRAIHPRPRQRAGDGRHLDRRRRRPTATARSTSTSSPPSCSTRSSSTRPPRPRSTRARSARSSISTPATRWAARSGFTVVGSAQASYNDLAKNARPAPRRAAVVEVARRHVRRRASRPPIKDRQSRARQQHRALGAGALRFGQRHAVLLQREHQRHAASPTPAASIARARRATRRRSPSTRASRATARSSHDRERLGLTGSVQWSPTERDQDLDRRPLLALQGNARGEVRRGAAALERALDRRASTRSTIRNNNMIAGDAQRRLGPHRALPAPVEDRILPARRQLGSGRHRQLPLHAARRHLEVGRQHPGRDDLRVRRPRRAGLPATTTPTCTQPAADLRHQRHRSGQLPARRNPRPPVDDVTNKFRTAQLRTEWDVTDGFQLKAGGVYRRFTFESKAFTRDAVVCPATAAPDRRARHDHLLGDHRCSAPTAVYGFPATGLGEPSRSATPASRRARPTSSDPQHRRVGRTSPASTAARRRSTPATTAASPRRSTAATSSSTSRASSSGCATPPTPASATSSTDQSSTGLNSGVARDGQAQL